MYVCRKKKKFKETHHMGKLDFSKGKSFLILHTTALFKFFTTSYIKKMFSAGLKFTEKNFT